MKKNDLDAFKAKANAVLLSKAMLNVTGGLSSEDTEYCHVKEGSANGNGKLEEGYAPHQVDQFFADPGLTMQFDSMYDPSDPNSPFIRDDFFRSVVSAW